MIGDLISRAELHKRMFPYEGTDKRGYSINAKAVENAILEAPDAIGGEWINVCDKLPAGSCDVMACTVNPDTGRYIWLAAVPYSAKNKAFNSYDDDRSSKNWVEVEFWMPLPPMPGRI